MRTRLADLRDIEQIEGVPFSEQVPHRTIFDWFAATARRHPDKIAIRYLGDASAIDEAMPVTYGELLSRALGAAELLGELALNPVVSIVAPNLIGTLIAFLAAHAVGRTSLINIFLEPRHMAEICNAVGCRGIVAPTGDFFPEVAERVAKARQSMVDPPRLFEIGASLDGWPSQPLTSKRSSRAQRDDVATFFHTGGTTGSPKIAPLTHQNEVYAAWAQATVAGITRDDVVVSGMPWFHGGGLFINTITPLCAGAEVIVLGPLGYRDREIFSSFWRVIERFKVTFFLGVPTVFQALSTKPVDGHNLTSLRLVACGGAPLSRELIRLFQEQTGLSIYEGYGLTEAGISSFRNPRDGERRIGSVGLRFPYQQVRVVRLDATGAATDCAPGETGTILLKGPNVFPGYLQAKHNQNLFVEGSLNTGDIGQLDEQGYLWLTGREKDLIIRGGHNIDPAQIEEVLHRHPDVLVAAAVGRPDAYSGEVPVAYVALKPQATCSGESLRSFAAANIGERAAIPVEVIVRPELPASAVGKLLKRELSFDAARREFEAALLKRGAGERRCRVQVGSGSDGHLRATIQVLDDQPATHELIKEALAPYAVAVEVTTASISPINPRA